MQHDRTLCLSRQAMTEGETSGRSHEEEQDGVQTTGDTDATDTNPTAMTSVTAADNYRERAAWGDLFRPALEEMVEPIIALILKEVPAYGGPTGGRRHQWMSLAGHEAITAFLDHSPEGDTKRRKVEELFRKMGWRESQAGHSIQGIHAALALATRTAWDRLSRYAVQHDLPVSALRDATRDLHNYTDHLHQELLTGHNLSERSPGRARQNLIRYLRLHPVTRTSTRLPYGVDPALLADMAELAQWPLVDRVVAIAVRAPYLAEGLARRQELLVRTEGDLLMVVCPETDAQTLIQQFEFTTYPPPVAFTWAVTPAEAGSAMGWAIRALDLVDAGVIPRTAIIDAKQHTTQLWLHSEPSMRRRLCGDLLEPLLSESKNSREILSDTLLTWLETRDSAPALAARLDVHPQTVRYRWRRINELFGDALHEPEFVTQITMVLKASLPMWKAGDHTDFDLFREAQATES